MLDKNDETKIGKIVMKTVVDALEQVVLPKFDDQDKEMDKKFKKVDERFRKVDEKLEEIDERFDDVDASLNRIETLVKSEIKYVDNLSSRVVALETKKA